MTMTDAERRLLKSLESLEKGGDALQDAPHDGGFATEGTNIQSLAKAKVMKALVKSGMSKADAEETIKAMYVKSDDASSDGDSESVTKGGDDDSMSADDESGSDDQSGGDDESGEESGADSSSMPSLKKGKKVSKSTGAAQLANASSRQSQKPDDLRKALVDGDPRMAEAFDAAPILGKLIDSIDRMAKSGGASDELRKSMRRVIRKSIDASTAKQEVFNRKVAKGFELLFDRLATMTDLVKAIHDTPVANNRTGNLRKSDTVERDFGTTDTSRIDGSEPISPLQNVDLLRVQEALFQMCIKGEADILDVTKFENSRGNLSLLPKQVVERLEKQLCSAA